MTEWDDFCATQGDRPAQHRLRGGSMAIEVTISLRPEVWGRRPHDAAANLRAYAEQLHANAFFSAEEVLLDLAKQVEESMPQHPLGTVVQDREGDYWVADRNGMFHLVKNSGFGDSGWSLDRIEQHHGPVEVV